MRTGNCHYSGLNAVLLAVVSAALLPRPQAEAQERPNLSYKVPNGWTQVRPSSRMRYAQFRLPRVEKDSEDAELVVYYFGPRQGGSVQANLERWIGQMVQPDGSSSRAKASITKSEVRGMPVTTLKINGTYRARMGGGPFMQRKVVQKTGYRMVAGVLESKSGSFFLKLTGPEETVKKWEKDYEDFVKSMKLN